MKAAIYKGPGQPLVIEQIPDPEPAREEVVIRVERCGVCGTDLHMTSGHGQDVPIGGTLGHEFAGEVVALGRDVGHLKLGDRITAMPMVGCGACSTCAEGYPVACEKMQGFAAGFAEYMAVPAASAAIIPADLTLADGALIEPMSVGRYGVRLAQMPPNARVLVLGAGSIGLATIFWARLMGAGRIVAASPSPRRAPMALEMGADAFEVLGEGDEERIAERLGGPPDVVFECAGAVGSLGKAVDLVRPGGDIISMGFCMTPDPLSPFLATWKRVTIRFSFCYTLDDFRQGLAAMERGHVEPRQMISETVSLEEFPAALEALRGGAPFTKLHVAPWL